MGFFKTFGWQDKKPPWGGLNQVGPAGGTAASGSENGRKMSEKEGRTDSASPNRGETAVEAAAKVGVMDGRGQRQGQGEPEQQEKLPEGQEQQYRMKKKDESKDPFRSENEQNYDTDARRLPTTRTRTTRQSSQGEKQRIHNGLSTDKDNTASRWISTDMDNRSNDQHNGLPTYKTRTNNS